MDKQLTAALFIALLAAVLALLIVGWRSRRRRQSAFAAPQVVPSDLGAQLGGFEGFYVATTVAGDRLNRVAVHGLGFRAKTTVGVYAAGIVVPIAGQTDTFIPAADIARVERATWTIDRVVETDGLVVVTWSLGDTSVDTYFRPRQPAALLAAIAGIAPAAAPATTESDSK